MELEIAHVLGVSEYAAQQIYNITMNVGSLLSIATAIATIVSMGWAGISAVGWSVFFATVKSIARRRGAGAAISC